LSAVHADTPIDCNPDGNTDIAYGDLVACDITVGDSDLFRFNGTVDEVIYASVADLSGSNLVLACLTLRDPLGTVVDSQCSNTRAFVNATLAMVGEYSLEVTEADQDAFGYGLNLERVAPTPSPEAVQISYGDNLTDAIDLGSDSDLFTFIAQPGDVINAKVTDSTGSNLVIGCILLLGPDGLETPGGAQTCNNITAQITETIGELGRHTIRVIESDVDTMTYTVDLQCIAGPCESSGTPDVVGSLRVDGAPQAGALVILRGSDGSTDFTQTNAQGGYRFFDVPAGDFTVIIRGNNTND
jgi:hypothetical protein